MRRHILLEKAFVYEIPSVNEGINNYAYNAENGFWTHLSTGVPLMFDEIDFRPRTKKEDCETGEDRKGE